MSLDQVSSVPSSHSGSPYGGITGTFQGGLSSTLNAGQGWLDRFFPPEKREELKNKIAQFATERPYLFAFLLAQIALSGPAIALFVITTLIVAIFSLLTAVLVAVAGALSFIVFAVGIALCFLLPTLFVTTLTATAIFLWGVGVYLLFTWFSERDPLGIHTEAESGTQKQSGLDGVLNGVPGGNALTQAEHDERNKTDPRWEQINGVKTSAMDAIHHADGKKYYGNPRTFEYSERGIRSAALGKPARVKMPEVDTPISAVGDARKQGGISYDTKLGL